MPFKAPKAHFNPLKLLAYSVSFWLNFKGVGEYESILSK